MYKIPPEITNTSPVIVFMPSTNSPRPQKGNQRQLKHEASEPTWTVERREALRVFEPVQTNHDRALMVVQVTTIQTTACNSKNHYHKHK
jgi:hypothetical protein